MTDNETEFWRDDPPADASSVAALPLRMPAAAVVVPPDLAGSHATASADYRAMPKEKQRASTQGWFILAALIAIAVWMTASFMAAVSNRSKAREQLISQVAGKASETELATYQAVMESAFESGVLLKLHTEQRRADVFVLPRFHLLNVDQKSQLIRVAYFAAFELPSDTRTFPWPMAVMDGMTGKRLNTVDLDSIGLGW